MIDVFLAILSGVVFVLLWAGAVYAMAYFQHPADNRSAYFPKIVVVRYHLKPKGSKMEAAAGEEDAPSTDLLHTRPWPRVFDFLMNYCFLFLFIFSCERKFRLRLSLRRNLSDDAYASICSPSFQCHPIR